MTEGEFQEFLITVGYRYNAKSKSGFNTFEGFHTIVQFLTDENRYSFILGAATDDLQELNERLRTFSSENKRFVTKAKYKDKEMWCTTLVGQGSEDMIGFNHPGLSDEFELWAKTNPAKKDELFPNLENVINDYYKWREDKK